MVEISFPYIDTEVPANYLGNFIDGSPDIPQGAIKALSQPDPATLVTFDGGFSWVDPDDPTTPVGPAVSSEAVIGNFIAGDNVIANKVVYLKADGTVEHADKDASIDFNDVLGVANNSAAIGNPVEVTHYGKVSNASIGPIGSTYWLGNTGDLISTAPLLGVIQHIARQITTKEIFVEKHRPIKRC